MAESVAIACPTLKHVLVEIVDVGGKNLGKLFEAGIRDIEKLFLAKDRLKNRALLGVKKVIQNELYEVLCWVDDYEKRKGRKPEICQDLDPESFEAFQTRRREEEKKARVNMSAEFYRTASFAYRTAPSEERAKSLKFIPQGQEGEEVIAQAHTFDVEEAINSIPCRLKERCGNFDCRGFVQSVREVHAAWEAKTMSAESPAASAIDLPDGDGHDDHDGKTDTPVVQANIGNREYDGDELVAEAVVVSDEQDRNLPVEIEEGRVGFSGETFLVQGRTQAGKSAFKAVFGYTLHTLKLGPLFILTKGVPESKDLASKIRGYVASSDYEGDIICKGDVRGKSAQGEIDRVVENCGTVILADTAPQFSNGIKAVETLQAKYPSRPFFLAVDECDSMYRTYDRRQKMEIKYDELMSFGPACLRVMISATLMPIIPCLIEESETSNTSPSVRLYQIEAIDEYVGLEDLKPLEVGGTRVFLEQNDLKHSVGVAINNSSREEEKFDEEDDNFEIVAIDPETRKQGRAIPYADGKVMKLYTDAARRVDGRKGVLLLDCTSPRVFADGNVREKAELVQTWCKDDQNSSIVVITFTGRGISKRICGEDWIEYDKSVEIGEVIEEIDGDEKAGLDMPIFVFGFLKLRRGISYRSNGRVPTHFVVSLGRGHNAMNVIQAMGRATFNGKCWHAHLLCKLGSRFSRFRLTLSYVINLHRTAFSGKSLLQSNGFESITILTLSSDYQMALKYIHFMEAVKKCVSPDGVLKIDDLLKKNYADELNFLRHTTRELGQLKGQRNELVRNMNFAAPTALNELEEGTKRKYWDDVEAQRMMSTILNLAEKSYQLNDNRNPLVVDDVVEAYNDRYPSTNISKKGAGKYLRDFSDQGIIQKKGKEAGGGGSAQEYLVMHRDHLKRFINEGLVNIFVDEEDEVIEATIVEEAELTELVSEDTFHTCITIVYIIHILRRWGH